MREMSLADRRLTEDKRTIEMLKLSEARYRSLFESQTDIIARSDPSGKLTLVNDAYCRVFGKSREELLGSAFTPTVFPEDLPIAVETLDALMRPPYRKQTETRHLTADGVRWFNWDNSAVLGSDGKVVELQGVGRDITEHKKAEEMLKQSEEKFRLLTENSVLGIYIIQDAKMAYVNPSFARIFGYSPKEIIGKLTPADLIHPDDIQAMMRRLQERLEDRIEEGNITYKGLSKNGSLVYIELYGMTIQYQGRFAVMGTLIDVTERKRIEEALKDSEERYRELAESVTDVFFAMDRTLKYTYWNKASEKLTGIVAKDAIGRSLYEVFPDIKGTKPEEVYLEALRTGQPETFISEYELHGKRYTFEISVYPTSHGITVFTKDISHRKRMEDDLKRYAEHLERLVEERTVSLQRSEERYRIIADNTFDWEFWLSPKGEFIYCSPSCARITGHTAEEFLADASLIYRIIRPDDRTIFEKHQRDSLAGHPSEAITFRIISSDGKERWIEHVCQRILDKSGVFHGHRGSNRDITERMQAETELRATRERLDYMIRSNPAMIFTAKPRADYSDYEMTYISERAVQMLGFEPRQFIGHPEFWDGHVHPDDLPRFRTGVSELWEKGQGTFEYRFLHKDGTYRWIREEARAVHDASGRPAEVMGYWTDVTELKQIEKMKEQFISAVTHELRTPLTPIKANVDFLVSGRLGPLPDKIEESLQLVKRNADRLKLLTDELLDIRRLQSGKFQLEPVSMNIQQLVGQTINEVRVSADAKKQYLNLEASSKPLQIQADSNRVSQVLMNLLSNAIKFTPENGKITVRVEEDSHNVKVSVSDTGIGIREEELKTIFEPFMAVQRHGYKGTGLGLTLARELVKAHGGEIWAESPGEGKGTTVTFTLPKEKKGRD
jgi:PAS domain S-box-containing protein